MEVLMVLLLIVCAAFWWNMRSWSREHFSSFPSREEEILILETRAVTADFLEAGEMVRLLSREKYLGTISLRLHPRSYGRIGYTVCMYDTGDLAHSFSEFQKEFPEEEFLELRQFIATYGGCYDAQRDALVYTTRNSAKLTGEQKQRLEREVYLKIAAHPLADMKSSTLIHTRNLGKQQKCQRLFVEQRENTCPINGNLSP